MAIVAGSRTYRRDNRHDHDKRDKLLTNIKPCRHRVEGMLQFQLVDVNRHICPEKVFQPAAVVEMQVSNDDCFHVFDTMACLGDGFVEVVLPRVVVDLSKNVVGGSLGRGSVNL